MDSGRSCGGATTRQRGARVVAAVAHTRQRSCGLRGLEERAEQFTLFLQTAALESPLLAATQRQMRRGQFRVLALWWAYLAYRKASNIRRPPLMSTLALGKNSYMPV